MSVLTHESVLNNFSSKFWASAETSRATRAHIPGGYSRSSFNFGPHAIFVESGNGCFIQTVDGHELLDLNNNFTVNVIGHNHPAVREALLDAGQTGISFGNPVKAEDRLARMLVDRIPSVERVQFSCSATESCMSAVRIARTYTGRTKVAKFEGGYHGFSDVLFISSHTQPDGQGGSADAPLAVADSGGIPTCELDNVVVLPQNDRISCERLLRAHAGELSCLMLELQSGSGGLVTLDDDFVAWLREITEELGIVLIFDETISLRAGYQGRQGMIGVTPDLTVMGKMIGGGMPLGAVGGSADIMAVLDSGQAAISGTHHGHKLALHAGIACMEVMQPSAFEHLNAMARRITTELNDWASGHQLPFSIFGGGYSHMGYAIWKTAARTTRDHRSYWDDVDGELTQTLSLELANRGIFPVHRGEFSLSLPMTDADIDVVIDTFKAIVQDLDLG